MNNEPMPLYLDAPLEIQYHAATGELTVDMTPMLPVEIAKKVVQPRLSLRLSKAALAQMLCYFRDHPELMETLAGEGAELNSGAAH